jgi:hypothetical protein
MIKDNVEILVSAALAASSQVGQKNTEET